MIPSKNQAMEILRLQKDQSKREANLYLLPGKHRTFIMLFLLLVSSHLPVFAQRLPDPEGGVLAGGTKPRVWITSDIGGGDIDDNQSLVHILFYADVIDIVGISGDLTVINEVLNKYAEDYDKLRSWSSAYPTPEYLRSVGKTGYPGEHYPFQWRTSSPGGDLLIAASKDADPRPVYALVWGSMGDVALALYGGANKSKIRLISVGSANTCAIPSTRNYVWNNRAGLAMWIEQDLSHAGNYHPQLEGDYSNRGFQNKNIVGHGAMATYYAALSDRASWWDGYREGDSGTFLYLFRGNPDNPTSNHWGGWYNKTSDGGSNYYSDDFSAEHYVNYDVKSGRT